MRIWFDQLPAWWPLLAAALVLLITRVVWKILRRKREPEQIPVVDWQARAVRAEERAAEAEAVVKSGLMPYLARLLRARFVVRLLGQREHLVKSHQDGAEKVADLERRLAKAQAGLQEKLSSYEQQLSERKARPQSESPGDPPAESPSEAAVPPNARENPAGRNRRNPLNPPRPTAPPEPVRFSQILRRHRGDEPAPEPRSTEPASPNLAAPPPAGPTDSAPSPDAKSALPLEQPPDNPQPTPEKPGS